MKIAKLLVICTIYYHYSLFVSNLYHCDIARTSLQRDDGAWFQTWKAIVILSVKKKKYIKAWLNVSDEQGVLWWHTKIRCHQHFVTSVTYFGCWVLRMNAATNNATLHTVGDVNLLQRQRPRVFLGFFHNNFDYKTPQKYKI